jgi:translocation and assembly module TamB
MFGLLLLAFVVAQTAPGRVMLARSLEGLLSSPELAIDIVDLEGRVPDRLTIGQLTLSDKTGPWLTVRDVSLDWRPLQLLAGRLHIEQLRAESLALARLPASDRAAPEDSSTLAVPELPFDLRVDRLAIDAAQIDAPVIGYSAALRLTASFSAKTDVTVTSALAIERIDGPLGSVSITSSFDLGHRTLDVDAQVREAPDGLVAHLFGVDGLPEIDVALTGRGPIGAWRGQISGGSGANRVTAELAIAAANTVEFVLDGGAELAEIIPADFRQLVGSAPTFSIGGAWEPAAGVGEIRDARLAVAGGTFGLSGQIDIGTTAVAATLRANLDGRSLAPLVGPASLGTVTLEADVTGSFGALEARFSGTARDAAVAPVSAADVGIVGTVTAQKNRTSSETILDITATVETGGFAADIPAVGEALGARPRAFIAGNLNLSRGVFVARDLRLTGAAIALSAGGTVALDGTTAALAVSATLENLQRLTAGTPVSLAGAARVTGDIEVKSGAVAATLRGTATNFSGGVDAIDALTGDRLALTARITTATNGSWRVSDIALGAVNASLAGDITLSADFATIEARYFARVPDLTPLSASVGAALAGSIESTGTVAGQLDDLTLSAQLDGFGLSLAEVVVPRASVAVEAADLTGEPNGAVALDVGEPLAIAAGATFRLDSNAFRLADIEAESPGLQAAGDFVVPTDGGAITGTIRADADNLAPTATVFGQRISGQATVTIEFGEAQGEPSLRATLDGRDLSYDLAGDLVRAATLMVDARVAYARSNIGLALSLDAAHVTARQGSLDSMRATADGAADDIQFSVSANGDVFGKTELVTAGSVTQSPDREKSLCGRRPNCVSAIAGSRSISLSWPSPAAKSPRRSNSAKAS